MIPEKPPTNDWESIKINETPFSYKSTRGYLTWQRLYLTQKKMKWIVIAANLVIIWSRRTPGLMFKKELIIEGVKTVTDGQTPNWPRNHNKIIFEERKMIENLKSISCLWGCKLVLSKPSWNIWWDFSPIGIFMEDFFREICEDLVSRKNSSSTFSNNFSLLYS